MRREGGNGILAAVPELRARTGVRGRCAREAKDQGLNARRRRTEKR